MQCSLVPRPCPAFHALQAMESWVGPENKARCNEQDYVPFSNHAMWCLWCGCTEVTIVMFLFCVFGHNLVQRIILAKINSDIHNICGSPHWSTDGYINACVRHPVKRSALKKMFYCFQWLLNWLLHKWREGYLLPTSARKISCRRFDWMLHCWLKITCCRSNRYIIIAKVMARSSGP